MDDWQMSVTGKYAMKMVKSGSDIYVGLALPSAQSTSEKVWRVFKITDDGEGNITKAFADGNPGFCHAANNMPSLSYPEY